MTATNKIPVERDLSPQQDLFCQNYIIDYKAGEAAKRAKYSKKTAYSIGCRLLKKVKIQERIEYYKKQSLLNADITVEQVLNELKILAFSDITDIFKDKQGVVYLDDIKKMPAQVRRAIKSLEIEKGILKVKFHSKGEGLKLLGRYLSMFSDILQVDGGIKTDNELIIKVIQVNGAAPPEKVKR